MKEEEIYHFKYNSVLIDVFDKDKIEIQIKVGNDVFHIYPDKNQLKKMRDFLNKMDLNK